MAIQATSLTAPTSPPTSIQRSSWHSPVPYLFGGLAAILALIAFALVILTYSYWKLSSELLNGDDDIGRDLESGYRDRDAKPEIYKTPKVVQEKYLVIMAGHSKPTFLAIPNSRSCYNNPTKSDKEGNSELGNYGSSNQLS